MSENKIASRLSLLSERNDVIQLLKDMCGAAIPLTVITTLSDIPLSLSSLIIIDASLFICAENEFLRQTETVADYALCIIPVDIPSEAMSYAERIFNYSISFPVRIDLLKDYCRRTVNLINFQKEELIPFFKENEKIPDSIDGYFCGHSEAIKNVRKQILNAACSNDPVLLLGETGTGKTTAAQMIHSLSARKEHKMISVSLSTVVESLAESTFFGHARGSFTSADYEGLGCFEVADGSTLFMDELGTASLSMQAMLLTVLETGNYKKVGMDKEKHVDVRMIFATNADLQLMLHEGKFRPDLYFRIYDHIIRLPSLNERKEDLREMVFSFLEKESVLISEDAIERLEQYNWPGNIRELHKCLRRALRNARDNVITADLIDFGDIFLY